MKSEKQTQFKPNQTQLPKGQNERKLTYNKGLQKKRLFRSPNKQTQFLQRPKMNVNAFSQKDYENEPPSSPKKTNPKQTQNKPNSNPIKAYPERSEFTLSVIEGNGPILEGMNVNFVLQGIMRINRHSQEVIKISSSPLPGVLRRESAFRRIKILGIYTTTLLQFSCAQKFLANTIYGILPTFPRQTLAAVAGVKMGLIQGWFFSISKTVFAANLYNFRLSQKLAEYQTFLKFSDHYCRYQYLEGYFGPPKGLRGHTRYSGY